MTTRILISYSHDSNEHMQKVLALSDKLRKYGLDCQIDQYEMSPDGGWARWTLKQLKEADFVIVVCTQTYAERFDGDAPTGRGQGVKWEGAIITQQLYGAEEDTRRFVPVLVSGSDEKYIPMALRGLHFYQPFTEDGFNELYRFLTNQPAIEKPELGEIRAMPARSRRADFGKSDGGRREGEAAESKARHERDSRDKKSGVSKGTLAGAAVLVVAIALAAVFAPRFFSGPVTAPTQFSGKYYPILPFSLQHTMDNHDFLYWLSLKGENHTSDLLHIEVRCTILNEPKPALCGQKPESYTIEPGERLERIVDPRLRFVSKDSFKDPLRLNIEWKVKSEQGVTMWQDTAKILIAPKTRFYWPLANSANEEVDSEFLVATLASWATTAKSDPTYKLGEELTTTSATMGEFMKNVYDDVLTNPEILQINPGVPQLPPDGFAEFEMPKRILNNGKANPVEAGLLIGAITQAATSFYGSRVVGLLSNPGKDGQRPVLIAWTEPGPVWRSIDLTTLQADFDTNRQSATKILDADWFRESMLPRLDAKGVYFNPDQRRVALDFKRARAVHKIEGLP